MNDRLPGDLMTVGGHRLHVVTEGTGSPPVLLSAGLGGAWFDWIPVVSLLRDAHRAIVFDRPGLGGSPPVRGAATLRAEADRLAALARWAGAPVLLVAHSFAGFHAEAFARLHPDLVGGMVLVDPSAEPRTPEHARLLGRLEPLARLAGTVAGATGLTRLAGPAAYSLAMRLLTARGNVAPPEYVRAVCTRGHVLGTLLAEDSVYRQMAADLLTLRCHVPFPDIPLRVLTALGDLRGGREAWRRAHAGLAALSPRGRQVVLPDVGHLVHIDRPETVARAVREL
ncbi:alpha/beta hydrolase [Actinoallomurus spadix]|uniref:Alpha/beta hydrolase n=1 Tax=Actinoallomurus spadix TaxID=79912 RepID=A0ABN0XNJ5_9ACTN|nr:alpha/beta hydrolase [Actinoallomurus spadix]MCO5991302.1 alpha/beta hydrolase [Actinoallomurus spadix]